MQACEARKGRIGETCLWFETNNETAEATSAFAIDPRPAATFKDILDSDPIIPTT